MNEKKPFRKERLSFSRKAVMASASVSKKKNAIHSFTEIDISKPKEYLEKYKGLYGNKPSFTGYIVSCFSNTIKLFPKFNSFISGNQLICLDNITISVLVEREIAAELIPEPIGIADCQNKSYLDISREIRQAYNRKDDRLGNITGTSWFNYIPAFLLKTFITLADQNISMGIKYGKLAVTSVGMFSKEPVWFIPHGSATVLLTIGSIINRPIVIEGRCETREHLCMTVSFDHDIIDGAPAARFMNELIREIKSGNEILKLINR